MASHEFRPKIVRTSDRLQFEVQTDEPWSISDSSIGELLHTNRTLSEAIGEITEELRNGLRASAVDGAKVQLGLSLSSAGAFYITRGQSESHVIIEFLINSRYEQ